MSKRILIMKLQTTLIALLVLTGCMVGPDYHRPDVATPAAYKEAGDWKTAEPKDEAPRGNWWEIYGDNELNDLVAQVEISNQNVLAAAAQYRQVLALLGVAQSGYFPTVSGSLSDNRAQGTSSSTTGTSTVVPGTPIRNTTRLSFSASWEADIWGQIGRNVESNEASAQASSADLRAALLSAQATLVQTYFQLRANDAERQLLDQTVVAYGRSLQITKNRYEAGVAGRVDVVQAETQLKLTQAQAIDLGVQRTQLEHAIAVLVGKTPADFQIKVTNALPVLPPVPAALPAELLERRPDIAGAERRMAAANAQIGVAQAAFFPALTFNSTGGYQNSSLSQLVTLPNRFWSIGPSLALTLFDAGARSAQKESAIAGYDKSVATYRQTVLSAFQEVEDNLAALRQLADEAEVQQAASNSAAEALRLTENQYQAGTVSYLNVVTAQATTLGAQSSSINIAGRRLLADVVLIKALGGNWQQKKTK
jgi:NodT family efflux transporter outer membrane factor (OMF) lipoprotein